MAIGERTYSFRASSEFGTRLSSARADFVQLADRGPEVRDWLIRELDLAFSRRLQAAPEIGRDQSAFIRNAVELLVGVTEKVAYSLELSDAYAEDRRLDKEANDYIRGATRASAEVWQD